MYSKRFEKETFKAMFLPDTYYTEWDTDADEFLGQEISLRDEAIRKRIGVA